MWRLDLIRRESSSRLRLIWFIWFLWSMWFIWLVSFNPKPDNRIEQKDRTGQIMRQTRSTRQTQISMPLFVHDAMETPHA